MLYNEKNYPGKRPKQCGGSGRIMYDDVDDVDGDDDDGDDDDGDNDNDDDDGGDDDDHDDDG